MRLFSLLSLFSYFAAVKQCALAYGVKGEGQPTRCAHRVLPGLASACRPSNPAKAERPKP